MKDIFYCYNPFDKKMEFNSNLQRLQTKFFEKMVGLLTDLRSILKKYCHVGEEILTLESIMQARNGGSKLDLEDFEHLLAQKNVEFEEFNFENFSSSELLEMFQNCQKSSKNVVSERLAYVLSSFDLPILTNWVQSCLKSENLMMNLLDSLKSQCNPEQDSKVEKYCLNEVMSYEDVQIVEEWYSEYLTRAENGVNLKEKISILKTSDLLGKGENCCLNASLILYPIEHRFAGLFYAICKLFGSENSRFLIDEFSEFLTAKNMDHLMEMQQEIANSKVF